MLPRLSLVLSLLAPAPRAVAQLYSWHEGSEKRISVTAPAWYRADAAVRGPRVLVTEGLCTIDDTALPLARRRALARHRAALERLEAARVEVRSGADQKLRVYQTAVEAEKRARGEAGLL
jgi:hypothetical protein